MSQISRRRFLQFSAGAAVGLAVIQYKPSEIYASPEQRRQSSATDWNGNYIGVNDGRACTLRIDVPRQYAGSSDWLFQVEFTDFAGNRWANTALHLPNDNDRIHEMRDMTLFPRSGQSGDLSWKRLHLHTWDTNYITGWSEWRGQQYGMIFARAPLAAGTRVVALPSPQNRHMQNNRDWGGCWRGSYDGRPARMFLTASFRDNATLTIDWSEDATPGVTWRNFALGGFLGVGAHTWDSIPSDHPQEIHGIVMIRHDGVREVERVNWPNLHLHTWDASFISGSSEWQGRQFGMWFTRVDDRSCF